MSAKKEELLQKLSRVEGVDPSSAYGIGVPTSGLVSSLRLAIDNGHLAAVDLEVLLPYVPSPRREVMIHSIGLAGQSRKDAKAVAAVTGIKRHAADWNMHEGLRYMIYCLDSVDPNYNPFASGVIPREPSLREIQAQVHLLARQHKDVHGRSSGAGVRLNYVLVFAEGWQTLDQICEHTSSEFLRLISAGQSSLDLLKEVLAFFRRELKPTAKRNKRTAAAT